MSLQRVTAPAAPVLTTAEAKLHLRVDGSDEDALIDALVAAATTEAEHLMGRALLPQTWRLTLDEFADEVAYGPIQLRRPPVTGITSVKYLQDSDGVLTTLAPEAYVLAAQSDYTARLTPAFDAVWPATRAMPGAVQVEFTCGYANAVAVPEPIKAWIRLRIGALYENRQAWTLGKAIERNAFVDFMLDPYRAWVM